MRKFFQKNKDIDEAEDFVLFNEDASAQNDVEEDLENTKNLDVRAVSEALSEEERKSRSKAGFMGFVKTHKSIAIAVSAVLIIAIVATGVFGVLMFSNPLRGYAQVAVTKENIMRTMETSGVLAVGDKYEITSLVAGKIIHCDFEVGDEVSQNDILYKLDDTEAKLAVERAKNELEKASDDAALQTSSARIISPESGTIQTLNIKTGSNVVGGSQIGTIKKTNGEETPLFAYMSGQVTVVSVKVGQSVSTGQLIATVNLKGNNEKAATYDKTASQIDLQSVQRQLENYTIKSPISGMVVEKNAKAGDNVGVTDNDKPMMVILDTSTLKFTFTVDEYMHRNIKKDLAVIITTESLPDTTFSGIVSAVSAEGKPGEDGKPVYDIEVTISEPGDLKAGMNVSAKVVLASVARTAAVPKAALMETDGQNALVFVRNDEGEATDADLTEALENQLAFPWIKVPKGCILKTVKYGITDGNMVQIVSGLKLGDIVVYNNRKEDGEFVHSTIEIEDYDIDDIEGMDDAEENEPETDEEIEAEVKKEIEELLKGDNIL